MQKTLADLLIKLGVDTKGFEKGMARAQKEMHKSFSSLKAVAGGAGLSAGLVYAVKMAKDWGNAVDDIVDVTSAAGEEASKLLVIAKRTGIGAEEAAGMFGKFGKNISMARDELDKAAADGKESNDIFSRLDLMPEDIKNGSIYEIYGKVAKRMRELGDGAEFDRAAMELFGKSGLQMHDMLTMTDGEMAKVIDKAQKMGLIISADTAAAWEQFDRNLAGVTGTANKLAITIGNELLPALQDKLSVAQQLTDTFASWDDGQKKAAASAVVLAAELGGVIIALKTMQTIMALNPWIALATGIAAAAVALYDYNTEQAKLAVARGETPQYDPVTGLAIPVYTPYDPTNRSGAYADKHKGEGAQLVSHGANGAGRPGLRGVYTGGGNAETEKIQRQVERMQELAAALDEKIMDTIGTQPQIALAKLNDEILKARNDIQSASDLGIDTSAVSAKLQQYAKVVQEETIKNSIQAQQTLAAETALINAQNLDDYKKTADAEYQATLVSLNQQKEEKWKATGDMAAAEAWYSVQVEAANKKRTQAYIDADAKVFQMKLDHINRLTTLEGLSPATVDQMSRQAIETRIAELQEILKQEGLTAEKRAQVEQELADRKRQIWEINGRDLATAAGETMRRIKERQMDYAAVMEDTYYQIGDSISSHLSGILKGTESFADGMRGIFQSMVDDIIDMMVKMWVNQYIMPGMQQWWGGIIGAGGSGGSINTTVSQWDGGWGQIGQDATGGLASGWTITGERGPELVNFSNPARVYTAGQSANMLGGNTYQVSVPITVGDTPSPRLAGRLRSEVGDLVKKIIHEESR